MSKQLQIDNKEYVSSVAAGKAVGYSHDYLSRLCRGGALDCRRIGRVWFIEEQSLARFVDRNSTQNSVNATEKEDGRKPEIATKDEPIQENDADQLIQSPQVGSLDSEKPVRQRNIFTAKDFNAIQQEDIRYESENAIHNSIGIEAAPTTESGDMVPSELERGTAPGPVASQLPQLPRELQHAQQTASSYQPVRSPVQRDDNVERGHVRRNTAAAPIATAEEKGTRTSFGPIVSFLILGIMLSGGGYAYARVAETPLHTIVRENAAAAKVGFEQVFSKTHTARQYVAQKGGAPVAESAEPTSVPVEQEKRVVRTRSVRELVSAVWDEMVQSTKETFRTLTSLSDVVLTYGTKPSDALATAFTSLASSSQQALRNEASSIYEPVKIGESVDTSSPVQDKPQVVEQTIVNQPVVERVVEQHFTVIESGVTLEQLQQTENELRKLFGEYASRDPVQPIQNFRTIALSQRIDNLGGVDITNSTFSGGSISDSSASLTTLSTTGAVTIGGDLTVTGSTSLGSISDLTLSGDLAVNGGDITTTATTWNFDVADTGTIQFRDGTNTLFTITDQGSTGDVTISGDLTISGDDITLGTNTSGFILVADGTNFNPVAVSGDVAIDAAGATVIQAGAVDLTTDVSGALPIANGGTGTTTASGARTALGAAASGANTDITSLSGLTTALSIAQGGTGATTLNDLITLGTHTTGNYLATLADAGNSFFTVTGSGSESAAVTLDIADDSLDFAQFSDTLTLDATTTVAMTGALNFDSNTLVINAAGNNVGIGTASPISRFHSVPSAPSPSSGIDSFGITTGGSYGGGLGLQDGTGDFGIWLDTTGTAARFGFGTGLGALSTKVSFLSSGDVGIGVTDPDKRLEVFETVADAQLKLSYDATRYSQFQTDSAGDLVIDAQGGDVYLNDENLFVCTGGSCPAGTPASTGTIVAESRVGIGVSDPAAPLEFASNVQSGMDAYTDFQILLHDSGTAATSYGIGIESNTLAFNSDGEYDFYIDGGATPEVNITNATSTFQGDLVIAGKLDVDTIDPVYTISGVKYATYGHSTIGVKEEAAVKLSLESYDPKKKLYHTTIDFDEVERGSDLWLFYQVSSFGSKWERLLVNLTPAFKGNVHYEEDIEENRITIYGDKKGFVSARFIADRYDATEWPNLRDDQGKGHPGHMIEEK